jgi:hypothetical protein
MALHGINRSPYNATSASDMTGMREMNNCNTRPILVGTYENRHGFVVAQTVLHLTSCRETGCVWYLGRRGKSKRTREKV